MDDRQDKNQGWSDGDLPSRAQNTSLQVPELDTAEYLADMQDMNISDAQKIEYLTILWDILRRFVACGLDVRADDLCGKLFACASGCPCAQRKIVESAFDRAAGSNSVRKVERD